MKILIIDDDKNLSLILKNNLENCGFLVTLCREGDRGLKIIKKNSHDLVIIDLNLPNICGGMLCKLARKNKIMIPILILSGDNNIDCKAQLLDCGADDYLTKPFCFKELIARINALLRRPQIISKNIIKIKNLQINLRNQLVKRDGKEIFLTRKEYLILELLASSPNKIFSRNEISEKVWDNEIDIFSKAIETHILNIRNKIDKPYKTNLIKTMTSRGYKIS